MFTAVLIVLAVYGLMMVGLGIIWMRYQNHQARYDEASAEAYKLATQPKIVSAGVRPYPE